MQKNDYKRWNDREILDVSKTEANVVSVFILSFSNFCIYECYYGGITIKT